MNDHTEITYLFWLAVVTYTGYVLLGYLPPDDKATAAALSSGTYGIVGMVIGGLLRAMGVNGKSVEPPRTGVIPKFPGT